MLKKKFIPSNQTSWLSGFELLSRQGVFSSYINAANVYDLERVASKDSELDISVMRLSRPSNRVPLVIASSFS